MLQFLIGFVLLLIVFVYWKKSKYWKSKGVPGPTPLPLIGNLGPHIIGKKNPVEIYADIYMKYREYPFVGIYRMVEPCLLLRDPEIIKNIMVKDFSYFVNNDNFVYKENDPLVGRNPFFLKGEEWKKTRHQLTPGFAPTKIKSFFPLMENTGKNLVKYLEKQEGAAVDAKDVSGRYTCDIVAACAFGLEANSFHDPNAQFLQTVRKFASPDSLIQKLKLAVGFFLPHIIKVKLVPRSFDDDVIEITKETLKYRQENNVIRGDYFEAMSQLTDNNILELAGHLTGFIIDGYETAATGLTFMLYELATNPRCQNKLRDEINTVLQKWNGEFSYEALKDMSYLEACISESLRIHPPLAQLSKTCSKTYTITTTNNEFKKLNVTLEPGSSVIVPLLGLHMDPKYFPYPEEFRPERFMEKTDSFKNAYMPFGNGPRACLGSRFGLLQVKVGLVSVIRNFELSLDEKSQQPMKYDPIYFLLNPKGGARISFQKIYKQ